jgi:hypothetical protein
MWVCGVSYYMALRLGKLADETRWRVNEGLIIRALHHPHCLIISGRRAIVATMTVAQGGGTGGGGEGMNNRGG